jgi:hypothetical protein
VRRSPAQLVLAAGALAAAVGSIVGFGGTVASWLEGPPPGTVRGLSVQSAEVMTYGESLERDTPGAAADVPESQRRVPGRLIAYDVDTTGFTVKDVLPVRVVLRGGRAGIRRFDGQPVIGGHGDTCGCSQWVPVPRGNAHYTAEVQIFPPGPVRPGQQPVRRAATRFTGSTR